LKKQYEVLQRDLVIEEELKVEVLRIEGCVLAAALLNDVKLEQIQRAQLISESAQILNQIDFAALFDVVFQVAKNTSSWSSDQTIGAMLSASEVFGRVERDLPEINSAYRKKLTHWFDGICKHDVLVDEKQTFRVLSDADKFVKNLEKAFPYMSDQLEKTRVKWAEQYLDNRKFDASIKILEQLIQRDHKLEARCYVEAGKPALASASYELAGDIEMAISCARQVPDIDRALKLATEIGSPSQQTLQWLSDVKDLFDSKGLRGAGDLTKEEGKTLQNWATKSLEKAPKQESKGN
jgi:tetratricopeptide (TPR) repeat protein